MLGHPCGHWRMTLTYHSYANTCSKIWQFKGFNVEVEIIKVLEENVGETTSSEGTMSFQLRHSPSETDYISHVKNQSFCTAKGKVTRKGIAGENESSSNHKDVILGGHRVRSEAPGAFCHSGISCHLVLLVRFFSPSTSQERISPYPHQQPPSGKYHQLWQMNKVHQLKGPRISHKPSCKQLQVLSTFSYTQRKHYSISFQSEKEGPYNLSKRLGQFSVGTMRRLVAVSSCPSPPCCGQVILARPLFPRILNLPFVAS